MGASKELSSYRSRRRDGTVIGLDRTWVPASRPKGTATRLALGVDVAVVIVWTASGAVDGSTYDRPFVNTVETRTSRRRRRRRRTYMVMTPACIPARLVV